MRKTKQKANLAREKKRGEVDALSSLPLAPSAPSLTLSHSRASFSFNSKTKLLPGGIAVTLVGHPFDTVKVRLQTQPSVNPVYC